MKPASGLLQNGAKTCKSQWKASAHVSLEGWSGCKHMISWYIWLKICSEGYTCGEDSGSLSRKSAIAWKSCKRKQCERDAETLRKHAKIGSTTELHWAQDVHAFCTIMLLPIGTSHYAICLQTWNFEPPFPCTKMITNLQSGVERWWRLISSLYHGETYSVAMKLWQLGFHCNPLLYFRTILYILLLSWITLPFCW